VCGREGLGVCIDNTVFSFLFSPFFLEEERTRGGDASRVKSTSGVWVQARVCCCMISESSWRWLKREGYEAWRQSLGTSGAAGTVYYVPPCNRSVGKSIRDLRRTGTFSRVGGLYVHFSSSRFSFLSYPRSFPPLAFLASFPYIAAHIPPPVRPADSTCFHQHLSASMVFCKPSHFQKKKAPNIIAAPTSFVFVFCRVDCEETILSPKKIPARKNRKLL